MRLAQISWKNKTKPNVSLSSHYCMRREKKWIFEALKRLTPPLNEKMKKNEKEMFLFNADWERLFWILLVRVNNNDYEGKTKSWDTDKKCPKLRHLPICRRRRSHNLEIRQRWRYIPCNNVLCPYIILWNKNQQIVRGLLNCANRDMQRKKERKNLRSSETAAPHVGSIKKDQFCNQEWNKAAIGFSNIEVSVSSVFKLRWKRI